MYATAWCFLFLFCLVVDFLAVRKIKKDAATIDDLNHALDIMTEAYNGVRQYVKAQELNKKSNRDEELRRAYARKRDEEAERLHREIEDITGGNNGNG